MVKNNPKIAFLTVFSLLTALLLPTVNAPKALSTSVASDPIQEQSHNTIAQNRSGDAAYKKAKAELPEDWYTVYRIIDRIARANGLDNNPWRVVVVDEYNLNAFATEGNLIALYTGLIDQVAGDSSAIACVVGHEMGHHVKRHIAMGESQKAAMLEQIQKETEEEVNAEISDANSDATTTSVGGAILKTAGGFLGGIGRVIGNAGGAVLENQSRQRISSAQARIDEIVNLKKQELEQRLAEDSRKHEFEADEVGYQYMAKAGFEPEGCLRMMDVLGRTPGAEFDSSHPAIPKRIEKLKSLMTQYPAQRLSQEGAAKINASAPLTYDLAKDKISLRINSRRGGSAANDIDRLFK